MRNLERAIAAGETHKVEIGGEGPGGLDVEM
jgi:hypothetical protein